MGAIYAFKYLVGDDIFMDMIEEASQRLNKKYQVIINSYDYQLSKSSDSS